MSPKLQYASSHAANYVTVKRVIADTGMIADAKWQTRTKCAFKIVGFAHLSSEGGATQANTLMAPRRLGEQRRASQCSRYMYRLDLLLWQQQYVNAFSLHRYRIIVSLSRYF